MRMEYEWQTDFIKRHMTGKKQSQGCSRRWSLEFTLFYSKLCLFITKSTLENIVKDLIHVFSTAIFSVQGKHFTVIKVKEMRKQKII